MVRFVRFGGCATLALLLALSGCGKGGGFGEGVGEVLNRAGEEARSRVQNEVETRSRNAIDGATKTAFGQVDKLTDKEENAAKNKKAKDAPADPADLAQ